MCETLKNHRLENSANAIQTHFDKFSWELLELMESTDRVIDIPLFCLIQEIGVKRNEIDMVDVNDLKDQIKELQDRKKVVSRIFL